MLPDYRCRFVAGRCPCMDITPSKIPRAGADVAVATGDARGRDRFPLCTPCPFHEGYVAAVERKRLKKNSPCQSFSRRCQGFHAGPRLPRANLAARFRQREARGPYRRGELDQPAFSAPPIRTGLTTTPWRGASASSGPRSTPEVSRLAAVRHATTSTEGPGVLRPGPAA